MTTASADPLAAAGGLVGALLDVALLRLRCSLLLRPPRFGLGALVASPRLGRGTGREVGLRRAASLDWPRVKIHEYQAKELLRKFGVAVPRGYLAVTPVEAEGAARQVGVGICAVKAQIHAGGRGKGGGVRLARSPEEARGHAEAMLGMMLRTPQTGPQGQQARKVYVEGGCSIAR